MAANEEAALLKKGGTSSKAAFTIDNPIIPIAAPIDKKHLAEMHLEAQRGVIASILHKPERFEQVKDLDPDAFRNAQMRTIFSAMKALNSRKEDINLFLLAKEIGDKMETPVSCIAAIQNDTLPVSDLTGFMSWLQGQRQALLDEIHRKQLAALINQGVPLQTILDAGRQMVAQIENQGKGKTSWFNAALATGGISRFLDSEPPPIDWVSLNSLPARTVGLIVGPGAAGKSTLGILMLFAVATGRDILPGIFTPTMAGKAIGIFGEDDEVILHHRVHCLANQLFDRDLEAMNLLRRNMIIITTSGHDIRFLGGSSEYFFEESHFFKEVFAAIQGLEGLRLIILDPISRLEGAEENDNAAGTFFISLLERIAQQTGAACLAIHHVAKRAGMNGNAGFDLEAAMQPDVSRGASGLTFAARWQCNLFGLPEKTAKKEIGISTANPGQYLAFKVSKKNYGAPEDIQFLERGRGGILRPIERQTRQVEPEVEEQLKELVLDAVFQTEGKRLTKRMFIDAHCQAWKRMNAKITRPTIEQAIAACVLNGELFERSGKNASGKSIIYLSRYPEPNASTDIRTVDEPEIFEPEKPEGTAEALPTVCNPLESQDKVEPEKKNRRRRDLRFISARNQGTVEP